MIPIIKEILNVGRKDALHFLPQRLPIPLEKSNENSSTEIATVGWPRNNMNFWTRETSISMNPNPIEEK